MSKLEDSLWEVYIVECTHCGEPLGPHFVTEDALQKYKEELE